MDFEWVAIAFGDVVWISLAFGLGLVARLIGLPSLVGFLATGFVLNFLGIVSGEMLQKLADLGITLLLFTVGLKLDFKTLARPQVWGVAALHGSIIVGFLGLAIFGLSQTSLPLFSALDMKLAMLLGFALSFSSTVFVVKMLEEKGEMKSLHGQIAIGILIMQDLAAVVFMAASTGKIPSVSALLLLLLLPLRPFIHALLAKAGHGDLQLLFGLVLALGGAEVFELAGAKGDLGALAMGILISTHPQAKELSRSMLGLKDLFLVGFFLSIGMSGHLTPDALMVGFLLAPLIFFKSGLYFYLMTRFKLRARTSLLGSINLMNYSEFGLLVTAVAVSKGWMASDWLVVVAVALSLSFMIAAPIGRRDDGIYNSLRDWLRRFQSDERLDDDRVLDTGDATIAIFGMGRVGRGAYDRLCELGIGKVVGIDFDAKVANSHRAMGRNVIHGDPSDADFWDKIQQNHRIDLVMLALPNLQASLDALAQLQASSFRGSVAAAAKYPDDEESLRQSGATAVFDIYTEAGTGFADHVRIEAEI